MHLLHTYISALFIMLQIATISSFRGRIIASNTDAFPAPRSHSSATGRATFTDLPPELRNRIYDLLYRRSWDRLMPITISAKKDAQAVPSALSRTCRLLRYELLPYFLSESTAYITLIMRTAQGMRACRDWISLVPAFSLAHVRGIKFKCARHWIGNGEVQEVHEDREVHDDWEVCEIAYDLRLDDPATVSSFWTWTRDCAACHGMEENKTRMVKKAMLQLSVSEKGTRRMTRECLERLLGAVRESWIERAWWAIENVNRRLKPQTRARFCDRKLDALENYVERQREIMRFEGENYETESFRL